MKSLKVTVFLLLLFVSGYQAKGQIRLGSSEKEINFRQAPGMNSKVLSTIGSSNLLVILPREPQNGFVEVFDIESSSFGFVYESLITVTDTLNFRDQQFFERSAEGSEGGITLELINNTGQSLYLWINRNSYSLDPHEKKGLVYNDEEIVYFSSAPGLYPVFGREILKKGSTYKFDFTLAPFFGDTLTRDTLRLNITPLEKKIVTDTVFVFSSRVDTIALQPVKTDTSKVARDVNPLDLEASKYKIQMLGSIRVNGYYDFTGMKNTEGFMPYEIPVGEDKIEGLRSVYLGARQSRLGMEGTASTRVGMIRTYIEVDFASNSESLWRLRHAYAEWNYFKMGYSWSTFIDNASTPTTIDFEGPNSSLSKRHGIVRYERKLGNNNTAGISIESPETDYYNPADTLISNKNKQGNFDIAGRYKYNIGNSHVQVAGIFRRIGYLQQTEMDVLYGWGILVSTSLRITDKSTFFGQYSFGHGIANYYSGFAGRQLDAVYDPGAETMRLKSIRGGFITYSFIFNPSWRFSFTGGTSNIKGYEFESDDTFMSSKYFASNIFYNPIETIRLGIELTTGSRTNIDEQTGRSTRISLLASFDF